MFFVELTGHPFRQLKEDRQPPTITGAGSDETAFILPFTGLLPSDEKGALGPPSYPRQVHGSEYVCRAFSFVVEWPPTSDAPTYHQPPVVSGVCIG